ncbi:MAG: DUF3343 domain-containing protein [Ruminococcus sp.]|nr:DUF3343 domain-containing protein [Ruminococcus sp.]
MILLNKCVFIMPSYTYAVKAQRLLRSRGLACTVKRTEKSSGRGCGFSLHINGDGRAAADMLRYYGIPFEEEEGGGHDQL